MKNARLSGFLVTACIVSIVSCTFVEGQESSYSVSGAVKKTDARPVAGAVITLYPGGYADTTDAAGRFTVTSLPAGDYVLTVSAAQLGLDDVRRRVVVPSGESNGLEITMREKTYHVDEIVVVSGRKRPVEQ